MIEPLRTFGRRQTTSLLIAALTAACIAVPAAGQEMMRLDADNSLMLREIGLVAALEDGEIRVITMMPGGHGGGGGMAGTEAKSGDVVLMINGRRVADLDAARAAYDAVAVGDEVKLAVRRDDRRFLVTFAKQDAAELEQGHGIVLRRMTVGGDGDGGDIRPILGLSIVASATDDGVSVAATLPIADTTLADGDVIRQVGGENVTTLDQLETLVAAAAAGAPLEVVIERDGARQVLAIEKQEAEGRVMVRRGS